GMTDELEAEDDVFLEAGVLYCVCGNAIEWEDVRDLIAKEAGREFVSCPACDMKHFAEGGKFRIDE
ncbi:MAG: hypothetical protein ACE5JI_09470, partial [Acidobacteriota bacterium]